MKEILAPDPPKATVAIGANREAADYEEQHAHHARQVRGPARRQNACHAKKKKRKEVNID